MYLVGWDWYMIIVYAILSIAGGCFIWFCTERNKRPKKTWIFLIILCYAFLSCVLWIYKIAGEMVNLLQTIGKILEIPDAVMGLSILAFGNSIDDFVADVALAKQGFPAMAMTGCYCSPLFQMLFGLGTGLIIQTIQQGPSYLRDNNNLEAVTMLIIAFLFLITNLLTSLTITSINKFTVPRYLGIFLVSSFITFIGIIVLLTTGVFKFRIKI